MNPIVIMLASFGGGLLALGVFDLLLGRRARPLARLHLAIRKIGGPEHGQFSTESLEVGDSVSFFNPGAKHDTLYLHRPTSKVLTVEITTTVATPEQIVEAQDRRHPLRRMRDAGAFETQAVQ